MARLVAARLARLERVHRAPPARPPVVVIFPDDWPEDARLAWEAAHAAADHETADAVVERMTGTRGGLVVAFTLYHGGGHDQPWGRLARLEARAAWRAAALSVPDLMREFDLPEDEARDVVAAWERAMVRCEVRGVFRRADVVAVLAAELGLSMADVIAEAERIATEQATR